jgi:allophanate hydrolase subunit 1
MAYLTEKDFERDVEAAKRVLKETYVGNIVYVQDRMKDGAEEEELKNIEDLIIATERLIVYFDGDDKWVKELHEEAKRNSGENDGSSDEPADEFERLEKAGNFERVEN